jgi:serine phosphatase RsbU (regulator of sigma subunit)
VLAACVGHVQQKTGKVFLCNAAYPPPLALRGETAAVRQVEIGAGVPLGMGEKTRFATGEAVLHGGDSLVCCSQGLIDARNPEREAFGLARLKQSVADNFGQPAGVLIKEVIRDLQDHVEDYQEKRPLSIMVIRRQ